MVSKTKYLLDTSIHYERVKDPAYIRKNISLSHAELHSLFFVLYEYKTGFIRSLIDFYFLVKIERDPIAAIMKQSNGFKIRPIKNVLILQALIQNISGKLKMGTSDPNDYLRMTEAAIIKAVNDFDFGLKNIHGSFAGDPVARHAIESAEDFRSFIDTHNKRKIFPLEEFWRKNQSSLSLLLANPTIFEAQNNIFKKDFTGMRDSLQEIQKDAKNANKFLINMKIGDAVIFTDTSKSFNIMTKDFLYEIFATQIPKTVTRTP